MACMSSDQLALDIGVRAAACLARVSDAVLASGRVPGEVKVLLATKTQPVAAIQQAVASLSKYELPVVIGENRVQEIVTKAPELAGLIADGKIDLHLIGPLQRNKINTVIANPVSVIESVDSLELAQNISERAIRAEHPVSVMLQVNVSGEATKSGCLPDNALNLAKQIAALPQLRLIGFMCIGQPPIYLDGVITNKAQIKAGYDTLRHIRDDAVAAGLSDAKELSMGMSADLEIAIAAGATIVRLGTAIFGNRSLA